MRHISQVQITPTYSAPLKKYLRDGQSHQRRGNQAGYHKGLKEKRENWWILKVGDYSTNLKTTFIKKNRGIFANRQHGLFNKD